MPPPRLPLPPAVLRKKKPRLSRSKKRLKSQRIWICVVYSVKQLNLSSQ